MQMEQGTTKPTIHPLKLLALAYGLMPELGTLLSAQRRGAGGDMNVRVKLFAVAQQLVGRSESMSKSDVPTRRDGRRVARRARRAVSRAWPTSCRTRGWP